MSEGADPCREGSRMQARGYEHTRTHSEILHMWNLDFQTRCAHMHK